MTETQVDSLGGLTASTAQHVGLAAFRLLRSSFNAFEAGCFFPPWIAEVDCECNLTVGVDYRDTSRLVS
jgi:hypothetical protein